MIIALFLAAAAPHIIVDVTQVPKPPALTAPPPIDGAARKAAADLFNTRCLLCHGKNGAGDGPSAAGLPVKPRRFSDALWQASVDDAAIATVIQNGGGARKLSVLMPPNPDLAEKPDVVKGLVALIRALRAPNGTARVVATGADGKPHVATADAGADGVAHVDLGVPPGPWKIAVDVGGGAVCTSAVTLGATDDVHVPCAVATPAKKAAAP